MPDLAHPASRPADVPPTGPDAPAPAPDALWSELVAVLQDARRIGLLGPGPVEQHVDHALALGATVAERPARFADLGSGAGVPGLVLATLVWASSEAVLVESQHRRIHHLERAIARLGIGDRVTVYGGRAEDAGRRELREHCDVVVARAFGPPPVVAECAVAVLVPGGSLYVSEPPTTVPDRWPAARLHELGFAPAEIRTGPVVHDDPVAHPIRVARLQRIGPLADRWPRTPNALQKRPLWRA